MTAREDQLAKQPELERDVENYSDEEHTARLALRTAELRLEEAQQKVVENAAAAEHVRTLTDADAYARSERDRVSAELVRARGATRELAEAEAALELEKSVAGKVPDLEAKVEAQREAREAALAAKQQRDQGFERAAGLAGTATRLAEEGDLLDYERGLLATQHAHLNAAEAGTRRCPTCEQLLGAEAREAALKTLAGQLDGLDAQMTAKAAHLIEARELAQRAQDEAAAIELPPVPEGEYGAELSAARAAVAHAAATQARIDALRELAGRRPEWEAALSLRNRALEKTGAELAEALVDAPDAAALDADVVHAKRAVADARATLEAAAHDLTRARQQLEQLGEAKLEHGGLLRERERKQSELDVLKLAERAFGRDGIPALIAENAIPQIEQEANRILELMPTAKGETLRVELRTQRELKTAEHLRETLDIMVVDAYRPRPYETYSGGEHGRINIALRLSLSKLLTARRGAESRLLVLDEVPHLDALGEEQLVQVVLDGAGSFDRVLVVTHSNIRDVFETAIELASDDAGMSYVVGSGAPVLELAAAGLPGE
jgi:exonuclease SbcC